MGERKLILNDGTIFDHSNCGLSDSDLWCWVKGTSFEKGVAKFFDPEATKLIQYQIGNMFVFYEGYTSVAVTREDPDGFSVCLTKPV